MPPPGASARQPDHEGPARTPGRGLLHHLTAAASVTPSSSSSMTFNTAKTAVETARASVHDAETTLSEAIEDAAGRARRPGSGATATVDPAAGTVLAAARDPAHRRHRHQPRHSQPPAAAPGPPGRPAARRGTQ